MKKRKLGSQGLEVSAIGYGVMVVTGVYGSIDHAAALATVRKAVDLGVTLFDTAEMYGWGENEKFLGQALKGHREKVAVSTKFGFVPDPDGGFNFGLNSRPDHIREVVENSLRFLQTDYIDLLYQHRPDPNVPPEDVAGAVSDLIKEGKVLHFGLSEVGEETLRRSHAVHPVSALQSEYSLFERGVEILFPTLQELGIGLVPYSPITRGFLTGHAKPTNEYEKTDFRRLDPRWSPGNFEKNVEAVKQLGELAQSLNASTVRIALAWLLAQGDDIVPIPGTRSQQRLAENTRAADIILDEAACAAIAKILPNGGYGARYIEELTPEWT